MLSCEKIALVHSLSVVKVEGQVFNLWAASLEGELCHLAQLQLHYTLKIVAHEASSDVR